jgi:nitrogen fixation protein NifU and related proteins
MKTDLYQAAIVAQARAATRAGRLDAADASVTRDNPLCGDRVTIDIKLNGNRITDIAHRVRGCLLCEASASAIGESAIGKSAGDVEVARESLRHMLEGGAAPDALWPGFETFAPVRDYKSRHACVMLPIEALRDALARAAGGTRK